MKANRSQRPSEARQFACVPSVALPGTWTLALRLIVGEMGADGRYGAMGGGRPKQFKGAKSAPEKSACLATIVDIQSMSKGVDAATKSYLAAEKADQKHGEVEIARRSLISDRYLLQQSNNS